MRKRACIIAVILNMLLSIVCGVNPGKTSVVSFICLFCQTLVLQGFRRITIIITLLLSSITSVNFTVVRILLLSLYKMIILYIVVLKQNVRTSDRHETIINLFVQHVPVCLLLSISGDQCVAFESSYHVDRGNWYSRASQNSFTIYDFLGLYLSC